MSPPNTLRGSTRQRGWIAVIAVAAQVAACGSVVSSPVASPGATSVATSEASATAAVVASTKPVGTASATEVDGMTIVKLGLAPGTYPIDVTFAFGSIWTANHHTNDVSRIDPVTMGEVARIAGGSGPGWFATTDEALWVSDQNGVGMTRIDPATNLPVASIGSDAPCNRPVVAFGMVWQPACDANVILRIDPASNAVERVPAAGRFDLFAIGDELYAAGESGLARLANPAK
jgi:streptogramin lyase